MNHNFHISRVRRFVHHGVLAALLLSCSTVAAEPVSGARLICALREGGYNIYFRHAQTDWSRSDHVTRAGDWMSCDPERMRQLSPDGRRTAQTVGEAMRALEVPVASVLASPYCRTVQTAEAMRLGQVSASNDIMNLRSADYFGGTQAVVERAQARLAEAPAAGTNTVLVAHGNVVREATGVYPGEGEAAVFRPDGAGGFSFVGRLAPRQWVQLAESWGADMEAVCTP